MGRDTEGAVDGVATIGTVVGEPARRRLSHWSLQWSCWPKCWRRLHQVFEGSDSCRKLVRVGVRGDTSGKHGVLNKRQYLIMR